MTRARRVFIIISGLPNATLTLVAKRSMGIAGTLSALASNRKLCWTPFEPLSDLLVLSHFFPLSLSLSLFELCQKCILPALTSAVNSALELDLNQLSQIIIHEVSAVVVDLFTLTRMKEGERESSSAGNNNNNALPKRRRKLFYWVSTGCVVGIDRRQLVKGDTWIGFAWNWIFQSVDNNFIDSHLSAATSWTQWIPQDIGGDKGQRMIKLAIMLSLPPQPTRSNVCWWTSAAICFI